MILDYVSLSEKSDPVSLHTLCHGLIDWNCRPVISLHQIPCLDISIMELSFNQKLKAASLGNLLKICELLTACTYNED